MMLKEITKNGIPVARRGSSPKYAIKTVQKFLDSGMEAALVDIPDKDFKQVYTALKACKRRHNFPVAIVRRADKVYLIREG